MRIKGRITKGCEVSLGMTDMFTIFITAMISQLYPCQSTPVVCFKYAVYYMSIIQQTRSGFFVVFFLK